MPPEYSLRNVWKAFEPASGSEHIRLRKLSDYVRWEQGWQGAGPLSYRSLERTVGGDTMRQSFLAINAENPPQSLREAYVSLGFPVGGGVTHYPLKTISMRQIARRVSPPHAIKLKFLSYNTYLLQGLQIPIGDWIDDAIGWDALGWFGIPFGEALFVLLGISSPAGLAIDEALNLLGWTPSKIVKEITGLDLNGITFGAKPALEARASELGPVLSSYDICCLAEVWTPDSVERIRKGLGAGPWKSAIGPDASGDWILNGSGLLFLARGQNIVKTERIIYSDLGTRNKDSDAWTNKGAMLNVIDLGFGQLELFQTHLYYGGGVKENLPFPFPGISDPSDDARMDIKRAELAELANFYRQHHQPQNIAIITGDFNMSGVNIREYAEIRRTMDSLNLRDLWAWDVYSNNPSEGLTCRFTDGEKKEWVRDFDAQCKYSPSQQNPQYCDDHTLMEKPPQGVGRFDFIFAENPSTDHRYHLEVSRILRRPFRRLQETDNEPYLSDHLGLDITLYCSPR